MDRNNEQQELKQHLQCASASQVEHLAAALIGRLLDVPVVVAQSGFQHGADAGPAGQHGRRFRLECKRYSDAGGLRERELLGEIDQALTRDEAIEAWILIATCTVPEQLRQSLDLKGERDGVPVIIVDWADKQIAPLAALCAFDPDLVATQLSNDAGATARSLQSLSSAAIKTLKRNLQAWCLGFVSVRSRSHQTLTEIWNSPQEAFVVLGQNAAGGAHERKIRRRTVHSALNAWWSDSPLGVPAAVVGPDGAGKTWATLDWLIDTQEQLPIVLTIASSVTDTTANESLGRVKQLLADSLYEITGVRDQRHWLRRLDRILSRPTDEGPAFVVFFDGLNQNTSVDWSRRLQCLQSAVLCGMVRVIVSTRTHYFEERLGSLRNIVASATRIDVDLYDTESGGELDEMLALEGIKRSELLPGVIERARSPRLFNLVIRFRSNLVEEGKVTVHRLLWEYGRDTLGNRGQNSFGPEEWKEWLERISEKCRDGIRNFSQRGLSESVSAPHLTPNQVYARLSDIIDGRMVTSVSGSLQLDPVLVQHALGAGLLVHLDQACGSSYLALDEKLATWLDPIAEFDQRSEILRAALSILIEQGNAQQSIARVLLRSWLQSQNMPDEHLQDLVALAPSLLDALLDAIEQSDGRVHGSARLWASYALRAVPRTSETVLAKLVKRSCRWLRVVSREIDPRRPADDEYEKRRSTRFMERIGRDSSGPIKVIGIELELVDRSSSNAARMVPLIVEGFPLVRLLEVFETAAATLAVADTSAAWGGLRWLCLLNEVDPDETASSLQRLSTTIRKRTPEPGLHIGFPLRISALLLWLTGREKDDEVACSIDPDFYRPWTYAKDYLPQPDRSFFPLERRHAPLTLRSQECGLQHRVQRVGDLWLDPEFRPPKTFVSEFTEHARQFDVTKLTRRPARTGEDIEFEQLEPALARCAPRTLTWLMRRKLQRMADSPTESRYWLAIRATDHILLTRCPEANAARMLRLSGTMSDKNEDAIVSSNLLLLEIANLDARRQFDSVIQAELDFVPIEFRYVVRRPGPNDIDLLLDKYRNATSKQKHLFLLLLSLRSVELNDKAWNWVHDSTQIVEDTKNRAAAFEILDSSDPVRFGKSLFSGGWSWSPTEDTLVNHYGSDALIEATYGSSFNQIASRLAPWRLLEAARRRGSRPADIQLAVELFGRALMDSPLNLPDPKADLAVDRSRRECLPFAYSVSPRPTHSERTIRWPGVDTDQQFQAYQRTIEAANTYIRDAWRAGANLYLIDVHVKDFLAVLKHAPDAIDQWLAGCSELTEEFTRRVRLAEGTFLSLCEVLMTHDPYRGTMLWRTLRLTLTTKYFGPAGVDELVHMVYRVPDSSEVTALRCELLGLEHCHNDQALFDIAFAASYNGRTDWLKNVIAADRGSTTTWRRRRAEVLSGFTIHNQLPVEGAWSEGECATDAEELIRKSARFRWIEACAHHWWDAFLRAKTPDQAYAAWVLFLRSSDRRYQAWTYQEPSANGEMSDFSRLKIAHHQINESPLQRACKKRGEKLERTFLGRSIVSGIGPWANQRVH